MFSFKLSGQSPKQKAGGRGVVSPAPGEAVPAGKTQSLQAGELALHTLPAHHHQVLVLHCPTKERREPTFLSTQDVSGTALGALPISLNPYNPRKWVITSQPQARQIVKDKVVEQSSPILNPVLPTSSS